MVLHHLTRGQLGEAVNADGTDKRAFYKEQRQKIADFANKVHAGEITNAAGEKFTTVVQIGIGGSDLGPRAMYLALENWAKKNDTFKMEAKFISNVDPDDAASSSVWYRRSTFHLYPGFQIRYNTGDTDQRVLRKRCPEKCRTGCFQTYDRSNQRDISTGKERRLSGSILYG